MPKKYKHLLSQDLIINPTIVFATTD